MGNVADAVAWNWFPNWFIKLFWLRFRNLKRRFAAIIAAYQAGTLPAPAATASSPPAKPRRPPTSRLEGLPTYRGWVPEQIGFTMIPGYELEKLVEDPELAALVAAQPELGSVLRPLCHMLAVRMPPWLRLPRRPRRPVVNLYPPPASLLAEPGAMLRADGSIWMRLGASTHKSLGLWESREEVEKFDPPVKIWPR